jgi:integrase
MSTTALLRKSRRLSSSSNADEDILVLPQGCELVANAFVVFRWQGHPCVLQINLSAHCWNRRRSGAIEHVLDKYGWTHSSQLYRVSSNSVDDAEWSRLKLILLVVLRLYDDKETGEMVGRIHWLNIMDCRLAYDMMRRECFYYHRHLYPAGSALGTHLKRCGVEVEDWYYSIAATTAAPQESEEEPSTPPPLQREITSGTPRSSSSLVENEGNVAGALGPREWLSDIHIANLMFLLVYGQLALPAEHRDHVQCIYPMNDQLVVQMLQRAEPGSLLAHAKVGRGVTIVFVNPSNNHWRLVILDGRQQQVVLFDPLGAPLPSMITQAVRAFVGPSFRVVDLQLCLQAESWNCGIWAVFVASRYIVSAISQHDDTSSMDVHEWLQPGDDFVLLNTETTTAQRRQNNEFASGLRTQYSTWLVDAEASGRLLYSSAAVDDGSGEVSESVVQTASTYKAGTAVSATRQRRFLTRSVLEMIWIDLTDDVDAVEAEQEEEVEQSYEDLADNFIEFREDNVNNEDASSLRYSLPVKLQSEELQQQITEFRAYRRQRFSLFRRGPLVEETTVTNNLRSLLRFLGYLHYEQGHLENVPLDMTVFALPNISSLVLSYVEWLEQRRGHKPQAVNSFQPVSCSTVANYLNGLISVIKFQLRHEIQLRDQLLEQLRNLRSQAESYASTQKKFEKVHPEWCSWQDLQKAREKCRAAFDQAEETDLLHLRELVLLCLLTICPPPRCSVVRLLEWDKTLLHDTGSGQWMIDLTDPAYAATRHKTHKRKGAMRLPLPKLIQPYLTQLRAKSGANALFPSRTTSPGDNMYLSPTSFTRFVKSTFAKYLDGGQAPNPTLLRSIFTTWLYGLRYDTEDVFLQEIKASSAKWKAHTEQVAATVYNKELVYQHKAFAQLLLFCEAYSVRFAYDGVISEQDAHEGSPALEPAIDERRSPRRKRKPDTDEYVVEQLVSVRVNKRGNKQVSVKWDGYSKCTWEPYESILEQLPEMLRALEASLISDDPNAEEEDQDSERVQRFLVNYVATHRIRSGYRWTPDRWAAFEHTVTLQNPPLKVTNYRLRKGLTDLLG